MVQIRRKSRRVHCDECGRNKLHHAKGLCRLCYDRQRREDNPGYSTEHNRQWDKANPGRREERNRQRYVAHRAEVRDRARQWRKANPDKVREQSRRRRALKLGATIGPVDEAAIYERDEVCIYCTSDQDLTLDHLTPLARGGPHCQDNLAVACRSCNSSKGARTYGEFVDV